MVPSMWDIMKGTKYKPFLEHFRIAAGLSEGGYHGAKWNDGDFYKWIEAVCAVQAIERNPVWDRRLDEIISVIGKAQRADGYIHTPVLVAARNGDESAKPFADRFNFEMYNMGHLMTAACRHHEVTGKNEFVAIARKAADFLDEGFHNPTPETARHAICPSHYMGILDLYRTTGERRYLELAQRLIRMRDLVTDGGDDNQDRVPFLATERGGRPRRFARPTYMLALPTFMQRRATTNCIPRSTHFGKTWLRRRCTSPVPAVPCTMALPRMAQRIRRRSRESIKHLAAITNCQTRRLTMKRARTSAMYSGTGGCF